MDVGPPGTFDHQPRTRVVYGAGTVARLGELAVEYGGHRALVVTDPGVRSTGHVDRGVAALKSAGVAAIVFDDVRPNPTTDDVDRCLAVAREQRIDLFVGFGGGSAMDCAKGTNFLLTNGGRMEDYWGVGKAKQPMLPMLAVPTTAGTGSEAQSFALIARTDSHLKMACGDPKAACRVAILDPELTVSQPASVTAATGIDAVSHAVESYVTTRRNGVSSMYARQAWRLLAASFPKVLAQPADLAARGDMLLGAHLAGAAIENSMLGATHALANPLSARFDTTHGVAIGIMLPHVVRWNEAAVGELYRDLERDAGWGRTELAAGLAEMVRQSGLPGRLSEASVDRAAIPEMAVDASKQWTGTFNPRRLEVADFANLYEAAW
jgi:alcohol dehydrogenase